MNTWLRVPLIQNRLKTINWKLLVFLILFLNVKLLVKFAVLLLAFLLNRDIRFKLNLKQSRLPLFYPAIAAIGLLNWLIYAGYSSLNYTICFGLGILLWCACLFASHQLKSFVEQNPVQILHSTIVAFFILNALVSILQYTSIVIETGALNAYRYQGDHQKYF